jgi:hypothetical protein
MLNPLGLSFLLRQFMFYRLGLSVLPRQLMLNPLGLSFLTRQLMLNPLGLSFLTKQLMFNPLGLSFLTRQLMFNPLGLSFLTSQLMFPSVGLSVLTRYRRITPVSITDPIQRSRPSGHILPISLQFLILFPSSRDLFLLGLACALLLLVDMNTSLNVGMNAGRATL